MDAQIDATDHRGAITKDVPGLRLDHITESPLLGMWSGYGLNAVNDVGMDLAQSSLARFS
jgi:hypothetical protein